jgi:hypothetical protein
MQEKVLISMNILYPSSYLNKKYPDEEYADEYNFAVSAGHHCFIYSAEDFDCGNLILNSKLPINEDILYRGWMMSLSDYSKLNVLVKHSGASLLTGPDSYIHCHHLKNWYSLCKKFTAQTIFAQPDDDFNKIVSELNWDKYFIKDYVKSLSDIKESIAESGNDISKIVSLITQFRGEVEGGVCIRKFEDLKPETEERYFVFNGTVYSPNNEIPKIVEEIASNINSPFFSIDIIENTDGVLRLVEIGDGQVSSIKNWNLNHFVNTVFA